MEEKYGFEWEKEMNKFKKSELIELLKKSFIKENQLEANQQPFDEGEFKHFSRNLIDRATPQNAFEILMKIKNELNKG